METKRFKPFLLVGGGVLVFNPDNTLIAGSPQSLEGVRQTRPAVLYGGGVDYHLISMFALRLQYRGLFYSPPDFQLPGLFTGGRGHFAEPTVGIVARF
jgi:opacity protein-like surface antigen